MKHGESARHCEPAMLLGCCQMGGEKEGVKKGEKEEEGGSEGGRRRERRRE